MIEYIGWYSLASLALSLSKPTPGKEIHSSTNVYEVAYATILQMVALPPSGDPTICNPHQKQHS